MAQYIDKDALVAEIERRIDENKLDLQRATRKHLEDYFEGYEDALAILKKQYLDPLPASEEEPKFKVGDTIRRKDDGLEVKVIDVHNGVTTVRCEDWDRTIIEKEWELVKEPVSIDFEKELYKAFGQIKDFTLGMQIAKWFYDMGKNSQEPVSEDLENAGKEWLRPQLDKYYKPYGEGKMMELTRFDGYAMLDAIEFGAKWQKQQGQSIIELAEDHAMLAGMEKMKEQMMTKSIEAVVSQVPCSNEIILYNPSSVDKYYLPQEMNKLGLNKGDKVKLVIIKEDCSEVKL